MMIEWLKDDPQLTFGVIKHIWTMVRMVVGRGRLLSKVLFFY